MTGTTEKGLHKSMMNTLQQTNLELDSKITSAKRSVDVGWVENGNPDYTYHQETATKDQTAITTVATENPTAAAQFAMIKGDKFI